jgi:protein gp37
MGADSKIEWTHHTFNPWRGCQRVSPGCEHCYAEAIATRFGLAKWGPGQPRVPASEKTWSEPRRWSAAAQAAGERHRVFCASMADVFEDLPELAPLRARLHGLIAATEHLDWLLLTKRPENADRLWNQAQYDAFNGADSIGPTWAPNVWLGTTVEDQRRADERIPHLLDVPARVRFLSCEPLLGLVDLTRVAAFPSPPWPKPIDGDPWLDALGGFGMRPSPLTGTLIATQLPHQIDWVIVGGESGFGARPMHPDWARSLRDQCASANVPYFFKQWGEFKTIYENTNVALGKNDRWLNLAGGHGFHGQRVVAARRVGKKAAGRLLDGRTHDAFPEVR